MGSSDLAEKLGGLGEAAVSELTASEKAGICEHITWLIRDTWKKYESLQCLNKPTSQSKPLNDNSNLNIRLSNVFHQNGGVNKY